MNRLKSIWHNQQAPNSVNNLKTIKITRCHALRNVFPTAMAKELLQLQVLEISMSMIEMIVEDIQGAPDNITFTKLEQLKLEYLPKLTKFCQEGYNFKFPSLQTVEVIGCPNLKSSGNLNLTTIAQLGLRGKNGQKDDELNNLFNEKVYDYFQSCWFLIYNVEYEPNPFNLLKFQCLHRFHFLTHSLAHYSYANNMIYLNNVLYPINKQVEYYFDMIVNANRLQCPTLKT